MTTIIEERLAEVGARQLARGGHESIEHGMCVMEAVAYVAGEPFSDHPHRRGLQTSALRLLDRMIDVVSHADVVS